MGRRSWPQCHRARSPGSSALPAAAPGSCPALTHTLGHRGPSAPGPSEEREEIPSCSTPGTHCQRWRLRKRRISSSLNGNSSQALENRMGGMRRREAPGCAGQRQALGTAVAAVPGRGQGCAERPCSTRSAPHGLWVRTAAGGGVPSLLALPSGVWHCPPAPSGAARDRPCLRALGHGSFLEEVTPGASLGGKEGGTRARDVPRAPHPAFVRTLGQRRRGPSLNLSC